MPLAGLIESTVILIALAAAGWLILSPRLEFRIRISGGSPRLSSGKLTRDSLGELADICRQWEIQRGWVGGVRRAGRVTLIFSRSVPPDCRQQIRNLWVNS